MSFNVLRSLYLATLGIGSTAFGF